MDEEHQAAAARVVVLIPCFNEQPTIAAVVAGFRAALPSAEIYVFDNNSTDRTAIEAAGAGARVVREQRQGKGHVFQSMFRTIDADVYVLVDGDGTYPAASAPSLVEPLLCGRADMVIGSRLHPGASSDFATLQLWGNRFFVFMLRLLFGIPLTDLLSGYRALTRAVVSQVTLTSGGFQVETELTIRTIRAGFRVLEVPVDLRRRPSGSPSKLRPVRDGLAILAEMLVLLRRDGRSS